MGPMLVHSLANYDAVWVAFGLASIAAFLVDWRRYLPGWLVAAGIMTSVVLLYLGPWSTVEYESGSRYIIHGALGWLAYALPSLAPALSARAKAMATRTLRPLAA